MPSIDLSNWMGKLPTRIAERTITQLVIPGSHNSASMDVDIHCEMSPEVSPLMKTFGGTPLMRQAMANWMKHQTIGIEQQLHLGVRYFDFKITQIGGKIFATNGLRCNEVYDYLDTIYRFLVRHNKELVIVHFSNYSALENDDIFILETWLSTKFGSLLCTKEDEEENFGEYSLKELWSTHKQIIFLTDSTLNKGITNFTWPTKNTCVVESSESESMNDVIEQHLVREREEDQLMVWNAVVTLRLANAMQHPLGCFEKEYGRKGTRELTEWIQKNGRSNLSILNIISTHFVDEEGFTEAVIQLNK